MNIDTYIHKAKILVEALPYINKFQNTITVIKYGGSAIADENLKKNVIEDISFLKMVGLKVVVVHGGGKKINQALEKNNIKINFNNGLRVTDQDSMEIVESVLSGIINKSLVSDFNKLNVNAVGISGKDANVLIAEKLIKNNIDLGFVGEIKKVNTDLILTLLDNGFLPVISPISTNEQGQSFNVNADMAAVEIAKALKASKLVFMTDIDGILTNFEDKTSLISQLNINTAQTLIENKSVSGGMIPKLESCINAVNNGVKAVHIINGKILHSLLLEIYTKEGIGTVITKF